METLNFLKHWSAKESPDAALSRLVDRFQIKINKYDDRVVLNYDQINSPKMENIVRECRALILSYPDFKILSRSFDRFFNYGEGFETLDFPFHESTVYSKEDGSLTNLYHDGNKWNVSSKSMAYAEGPTSYGSNKFSDVFETAIGGSVDVVFKNVLKNYQNYTWIFEMVSRETRVVKPYNFTGVFLLAIRDKTSGKYIAPESMIHILTNAEIPVRMPEIYNMGSLEDIVDFMKNLDSMDEGFVCYHAQTGRRVKVKNPAYLAIAHMRDNGMINPSRIIKLITMNETDEYLNIFKEDEEYFIPYQKAYNSLIEDAENLWNEVKNISRQKDFALAVKDSSLSSIMFRMKKGLERGSNESVKEIINTFADKQQQKLIEKYLDI